MKRYLAIVLSVLLLMTSAPMVSASGGYNDDEFNWGEYACTHSTTKSVAAVESTCTTPGCGAYERCVACGLVVAGSDARLPLADHTYDNACDADCNVCGEVRETAHNYQDTEIVPDCENSGYIIHTCTVCGDSYVDNRVDALGHDYKLTEDVAPTCVDNGKKVYVCAACGDSYTVVIPATGRHTYAYMCDEVCDVCGYVRNDAHVYTHMGTIEPTCGEDGSEGYKCWECGKCEYVIIPATGKHTYSGACDAECNVCGQIRESVETHQYVLTEEVAVTCTIDGKKVYTCTNCGDSYTDIDAAPGHEYDIVVTAPDCENGGYTTHTCLICGYSCVDNRVPALGHTAGAAADCENAQTCVVCGKELASALGHKYDNACDAACNVCGEQREITHSYDAVVTAPDCENGGYTTHTCSVCGDSYVSDAVSAIGHDYVPLSAEPPTCTEDGFERFYCVNCGDSYTVAIQAEGHKYDAVVTAPDCENGGYTTHTCSVCGDSYVSDRTEALGHSSVVVEGYAATCEEDGLTDGEQCSVCGKILVAQVAIPASGHSYDDDLDTDCNTCGAVREVVIPGDANGDGKVNNKDLALLQQYLSDWDVAIDIPVADVNDDGKVNNKDLALLQQYLADWDVVLK